MHHPKALSPQSANSLSVEEWRTRVSILELAIHNGYQLQARKGKTRPVLHHPGLEDTIIIKNPQDSARQLYQQAGNFADAGTLINFIQNRLTTVFNRFNHPQYTSFQNALRVVQEYVQIASAPSVADRTKANKPTLSQSQFDLDKFDLRPLEADNFLLQRQITWDTIDSPEFNGRVYTHVHGPFRNVAFPYYNGRTERAVGLELRNTTLKQHAPGSDRYTGIFVSNPPPQVRQFILTESVLDAMAYHQLSREENSNFDAVYFSTGGQLTQGQVETIARYITTLPKVDSWQLVLAFDNDAKGFVFDLSFIVPLAAPNLPLLAKPSSPGYRCYQLPQEAVFQPVVADFLSQIEDYNHHADEAPLIHIQKQEGVTTLQIPEQKVSLGLLNQVLINLSGMAKRVIIRKATGKDFCDDLIAKRLPY